MVSYLVCEKCGKYYELNEGKASFDFTKCEECGGRLRYAESLNEISAVKPLSEKPPVLGPLKKKCHNCGNENPNGAIFCLECGEELNVVNSSSTAENYNSQRTGNTNENVNGVSLIGICFGFGFLILSMLFGFLALFGSKLVGVNISQNPSEISNNLLMSSHSLLIGFMVIVVVVTIISGLLAAYISGSKDYKYGILNGGLVGVVLGVLMGVASGVAAFLSVTTVFGLLAVLGGILGTLLRRHN
ncbi:hypothetical protein MSWAN_0680 [Methanobacterium paludis]|uniref:Zinc-ribbon domain-containing protein n=1 Tax=Methanobacterium paludis (strain DSM 25820 / JCM 18151 / SWAN1) TaxID=868131 RepID=F6D6K2_METPW|nr:hypothetical protein MSWAN_0680 [Methanobacterium paludis]